MVLMAGASDHRNHATAKPASPATASASLTPIPSTAPANHTRLHDFAFPTLSWGAHRLLRCSKDGAGGPASPPPHPQTPSPDKEKQPHQASSPGAAAASASQHPRPWNLRTRRSATVAPLASKSDAAGKAPAGGGQVLHQQQPPLASPPPAAAAVPSKRALSAALTRDEIAEDFAAIRGTRPPRRPKKRPRAVQRQLDMLYPGLSLADVNLDSYKIDEQR